MVTGGLPGGKTGAVAPLATTAARRPLERIRDAKGRASLWARRTKADAHVLPDFLIIGAQKAGTTSLFRYLESHPSVVAPRNKELHFFDSSAPRPLWQYRLQFPELATMEHHSSPSRPAVTGEASPSYLYLPDVPPRVASAIPDARLIAVLREPVERAWSHWRMQRARGEEPLDLAAALDAEDQRLAAAWQRGDLHAVQRCSYGSRGLYADQLARWFDAFPREQVLVIDSDDLFDEPEQTYNTVLEFLDLPPITGVEFAVHRPIEGGTADEHELDPALAAELAERFTEPNARLAELTGIHFRSGC